MSPERHERRQRAPLRPRPPRPCPSRSSGFDERQAGARVHRVLVVHSDGDAALVAKTGALQRHALCRKLPRDLGDMHVVSRRPPQREPELLGGDAVEPEMRAVHELNVDRRAAACRALRRAATRVNDCATAIGSRRHPATMSMRPAISIRRRMSPAISARSTSG